MLKVGDKIRGAYTNNEYTLVTYSLVGEDHEVFLLFPKTNSLHCKFKVEDYDDIKKEEFEKVCHSVAYTKLNGDPIFDTKTYSIGDQFQYQNKTYILAQVYYSQIAMIDLTNGNRKADPIVIVESPLKITEESFAKVCGNSPSNEFIKLN